MANTTGDTAPNELPKARGWRRYQQLRRQDAADRDAMAAGLLECLGRAPTVADKIAAENIASLTVWARILERRGQYAEAAKARQQVTQAVRANPGMKPDKPAQPSSADRAADFRAAMLAAATPKVTA